jgi:peptidoglycan/xylan/chitin deacetylase (PgdA/CDA1 family)
MWPIPHRYEGTIVSRHAHGYKDKIIALTFDDGPDDRTTPRLLAALRKYNAKATFFLLGCNADTYPKSVKMIAAEGHAIGSHSYSHPAYPSEEKASRELTRTAKTFERILGSRPTLYRPTYGITKNWLTKIAVERGYAAVTWTINSFDTDKRADIVRNTLANPHPGDIVLLHDGYGRGRTASALPTILARLSAQGYTFVTVPELLERFDAYGEALEKKSELQALARKRRGKKA